MKIYLNLKEQSKVEFSSEALSILNWAQKHLCPDDLDGIIRLFNEMRKGAKLFEMNELIQQMGALESMIYDFRRSTQSQALTARIIFDSIEAAKRTLFNAPPDAPPEHAPQWQELKFNLIWKNSYLTGHPSIDFQHRHLFEKWQSTLVEIEKETDSNRSLSLKLAELVGGLQLHFESELEEFSHKAESTAALFAHQLSHKESLETVLNYQQAILKYDAIPTPTLLSPVIQSFLDHITQEAQIFSRKSQN